jgi:hypothetical protein
MRSRFLSRGSHQWVISLLLVALVVRALVPAGFMPSSDRPFTFQICPDGFPAQLLQESQASRGGSNEHVAHHHHMEGGAEHSGHNSHDHGSARAEHCVFAAAAGVGPAPDLSPALAHIERQATARSDSVSTLPETQRFRIQQPRAPPALS